MNAQTEVKIETIVINRKEYQVSAAFITINIGMITAIIEALAKGKTISFNICNILKPNNEFTIKS